MSDIARGNARRQHTRGPVYRAAAHLVLSGLPDSPAAELVPYLDPSRFSLDPGQMMRALLMLAHTHRPAEHQLRTPCAQHASGWFRPAPTREQMAEMAACRGCEFTMAVVCSHCRVKWPCESGRILLDTLVRPEGTGR